MANLLPEAIQNKVWATTRAHFIAVAAYVLIVSALFSAAALIPSYLVLTLAVPAAETHLQAATSSANATAVEIATTQAIVKGLTPLLAATSSPDARIAAIVAVKPKTVKITHLAYTAGKPSVLMITGVAQDRDAINTYRAALLASNVGSVTVPVSTLVGTADGQFTITVGGEF